MWQKSVSIFESKHFPPCLSSTLDPSDLSYCLKQLFNGKDIVLAYRLPLMVTLLSRNVYILNLKSCIPCFAWNSIAFSWKYLHYILTQWKVNIFLRGADYLLWKSWYFAEVLIAYWQHCSQLLNKDDFFPGKWPSGSKRKLSKTFLYSVSSGQLTPLQNLNFWSIIWSMEYNRYCSQGAKHPF